MCTPDGFVTDLSRTRQTEGRRGEKPRHKPKREFFFLFRRINVPDRILGSPSIFSHTQPLGQLSTGPPEGPEPTAREMPPGGRWPPLSPSQTQSSVSPYVWPSLQQLSTRQKALALIKCLNATGKRCYWMQRKRRLLVNHHFPGSLTSIFPLSALFTGNSPLVHPTGPSMTSTLIQSAEKIKYFLEANLHFVTPELQRTRQILPSQVSSVHH